MTIAAIVALACGVLVAIFPPALLGMMALIAVVAACQSPVIVTVGVVLAVRNLTDPLAGYTFGPGLNASALVGALIIVVAMARLVTTKASGPPTVVWVGAAAYAASVGVAVSKYGLDASLIRETVRVASFVALLVFVLAGDGDRRFRRTDLLLVVVAAAVVPAVVAVIGGGSSLEGDAMRSTGTLAHPNSAASLFSSAIIVAVSMIVGYARPRYQGMLWLATGLFVIALVLSGSLGGLAYAVIGCLAVVLLSPISRSARVAAVGVVALAGAIFFLSPIGADRLGELGTTVSLEDASIGAVSNSFDWRFFNWSQLLEVWQGSEVLGLGAGVTTDLVMPLGLPPHSDYVRLVVETGIAGVLVAVGFIVMLLRALWASARSGEGAQQTDRSVAGRAALALTLGLAVNALVATPTLRTTTLFTYGLVVVAALGPSRIFTGQHHGPARQGPGGLGVSSSIR